MIGSEKGSVLLIVIAGITIIAAIGAGIATMRSSSGIQFLIDKSDNNLSVQADYAAESGLERARFELHKAHEVSPDDTVKGWQKVCKNGLKKLSEEIASDISFIIDDASILTNVEGEAEGCEVTVTGWVGPDKNNPLAQRELLRKIDMENSPPPPPDLEPEHPAYHVVSSAEKGITLPFKASVDGHVYGKDVVLSSQAHVIGDVVSEIDVTLVSKSSVGGDICASGDVILNDMNEVGGDIHAHGNVTVGWKSIVEGDVFAKGAVTLQGQTEVSGNIHSKGSVTIGGKSIVDGDIFADGTVTLQNDSLISGSIYSQSSVILGWKTTVEEDVITEGDVNLEAGKNLIEGNAIASGKILLAKTSKIEGKQSEGNPDPGVKSPLPPQQCPGVDAPELSDFEAGPTDFSFGWKMDGIVVAPEEDEKDYRDLKSDGKNKIYFKGNSDGSCEFVFNSMSLEWDLDLVLDLSQCENDDDEPGDMTIFSEGDIRFGGKMNIYIITKDGKLREMEDVDPEIARRVYWETHGDFLQGSSSDWFGTILAKNDIEFESTNMKFIGAAASVNGVVTIGHSVDMAYMPANYAVENWVKD